MEVDEDCREELWNRVAVDAEKAGSNAQRHSVCQRDTES